MMNNNDLLNAITLGITIDFDGYKGMICHKAIKDDGVYVNMAFDEEDGQVTYRIFKVESNEDKIKFLEVFDDDLKSDLTAYWVAEELEENENK